jgi:hypothetical protein
VPGEDGVSINRKNQRKKQRALNLVVVGQQGSQCQELINTATKGLYRPYGGPNHRRRCDGVVDQGRARMMYLKSCSIMVPSASFVEGPPAIAQAMLAWDSGSVWGWRFRAEGGCSGRVDCRSPATNRSTLRMAPLRRALARVVCKPATPPTRSPGCFFLQERIHRWRVGLLLRVDGKETNDERRHAAG